jgi:osmotically-inducible protein OsmY
MLKQARERGRYEAAHFHTPERSLAGYAPGEVAVSLRGGALGPGTIAGGGPADMPPIRVGSRVVALDDEAGRVTRVLADAVTERVTHLVVRQGLVLPKELLVPVDWVTSVTEEVVTLGVTRAEPSALPEYVPDEELADRIVDAWWGDPVLHALMVNSDVRAVVRDGTATLEGYVWTAEQKRRLEEVAQSVPGVLGVRNEVVADDELALTVARALAEDPRFRDWDIRVHSYLGNVHLQGSVPDAETREAAGEVAARVPGGMAVINLLHAPGHAEAEARSRPAGEMEAVRSASVAVPEPGAAPGAPMTWAKVARGDRVRHPRCARVPGSGDAGVVDHVLVDPETHQASYLVIRAGDALPQEMLAPVEWIARVDADGIFVDADPTESLSLPAYRPPRTDEEIAATVRAALERRLGRPLESVGVVAEAGVVRLSGTVATPAERRAAVAAARQVPGVWEVRAEQLYDEESGE